MYESVTKRLACCENAALLGLYAGQYLTIVFGPALVVLGLGLWNPLLLLGGLLLCRLFFLFHRLQADVMEEVAVNERRSAFFGSRSTDDDERGG